MTTTITAADRATAWNIRLVHPPPENRCFAGTFQPLSPNRGFLTWARLYDDLKLCFDMTIFTDNNHHRHLQHPPPDGVLTSDNRLALWFRQRSTATAMGSPCVYLEPSCSIHPGLQDTFHNTLSSSIDVRMAAATGTTTAGISGVTQDSDSDDESGTAASALHLDLTVVVHDSLCKLAASDLELHIGSGCATHVHLVRNTSRRFLPIPTSSAPFSNVQTPTVKSRDSVRAAKRARTGPVPLPSGNDTSSGSGSLSPVKASSGSSAKYPMPPDLDVNIKKLYKGTCAITRTNTSWPAASMISGPAMQACHIVPKAMFRWFPQDGGTNDQVLTDLDLWNKTNSTENCMLMDSVTHHIHDLRLLAVDHNSQRVRLFAPIETVLPHSNKKARFPLTGHPSRAVLKWHYEMCVVENMCALMLDAEGGAKRQPWRDGPHLAPALAADISHGSIGDSSQRTSTEAPSGIVPPEDSTTGTGDVGSAVKRPFTPPTRSSSQTSDNSDTEADWYFTQELHSRLAREAALRSEWERVELWKRHREVRGRVAAM